MKFVSVAKQFRRVVFVEKFNRSIICPFKDVFAKPQYNINQYIRNKFLIKKSGALAGCSIGFVIALNYCFYFFYQQKSKSANSLKRLSAVFSFPILDAITRDSDSSEKNSKSSNSPRVKFNFVADIAENICPAVVYIEILMRHPITKRYMPISNGSGFIIKSDGLILTNAHVVANKTSVIVKLYDGREFEGVVEDQDTETDLATVRINAKNLPVLPLGQSSKLRPGEFVIAMGNPLSLSHTITMGVISSVNRPSKELGLHQKTDYIQTDAAINVGNSGGPLVNLDGEVIGINTMKVTEGISFAIPSDYAADFIKRIEGKHSKGWNFFGTQKKNEDVKQKYLGITMLTLTSSLIQELQQRNPEFPFVHHGVLVWRVMIGSPAYDADIRPGDIITYINGSKIESAKDIYNMLKTDKMLAIKVIRGKATFETKVYPQEPITP